MPNDDAGQAHLAEDFTNALGDLVADGRIVNGDGAILDERIGYACRRDGRVGRSEVTGKLTRPANRQRQGPRKDPNSPSNVGFG